MSLYHHVPNKDAIRARASSARAVLAQHTWALGLIDSRRNPGPATLRHHDAILGVLREAGFTLPMAAHAVSLIDSYIAGFVLQEANLPMTTADDVEEVAGGILEHLPADELPYLTEMIVDHVLRPGYDHTSEFSYGLDLILDALEARRR
ncbi:TetR/AcrR family transcriptional regulator C-terminal domain-containing protein [Nonomuraea turcica]|uniref:TetR/AcrR family transcriptional regulator C-terminal domain-containing protein n=1 Tax=Nonomuraea sp. G32 TaxID=3067274 RepID=UPI00273B478C|nr:TetR/AcrR family transcriptional regulator C-terminal domain-containing protein [Nonomuraea sp. G32]MDP4509994.1 TetR/AcrR family transcriptional regulator C-terminal domain-containing protein [Nonomuraea sp. G32]